MNTSYREKNLHVFRPFGLVLVLKARAVRFFPLKHLHKPKNHTRGGFGTSAPLASQRSEGSGPREVGLDWEFGYVLLSLSSFSFL